MTNTNRVLVLDSSQVELLRSAAEKLDGWDEYPLTDEQADFLALLLRSIANDRAYGAARYRAVRFHALQLARALGGQSHDVRCDSDCCHPDCAFVARVSEGRS